MHLRISKGVSLDVSSGDLAESERPLRTTITIEVLEDEEARIDEISAMLGLGDTEGRVSAARLLSVSRGHGGADDTNEAAWLLSSGSSFSE